MSYYRHNMFVKILALVWLTFLSNTVAPHGGPVANLTAARAPSGECDSATHANFQNKLYTQVKSIVLF